MTLLDEVRFSLTRLEETESVALDSEFSRYIEAAILDLTSTTDIKSFTAETADALQKEAIIAYSHYRYELDVTRKNSYKKAYDDIKEQLLMSSKYSTLGGKQE